MDVTTDDLDVVPDPGSCFDPKSLGHDTARVG
jgi:hypothetical protein